MALTDEQIERYSRHIILKEVGAKGQKKLLNAKVLIIGAGGLGAPAAMYLAAAGVGTIGIADADEVDLSNLQRQIIHQTADVGKAKVQSAKETINAMNSLYVLTVTSGFIALIVSGAVLAKAESSLNLSNTYRPIDVEIALRIAKVKRNLVCSLNSTWQHAARRRAEEVT